jgi:peptide/nickel transport system permease protein
VTRAPDPDAAVIRRLPSRPAGRSWRHRLSTGLVIGGLVIASWILGALAAPIVTPYGVEEQRLSHALQLPSLRHPFGTDELGRDVLARVLYGGRSTLALGIAVVAVAGAVGAFVGAVSAYLGGWTDETLMRATEIVMAFPAIILAMAIVVALGPGLVNTGLAMTLVWWPAYARLARGELLVLRDLEFVEAATAVGQSRLRIFCKVILPNVLPAIVVFATVDIGAAIVTGAALSFLGLGAVPPTPEWGAMVSSGREFLGQWWVATFPGLAIFMTVIAFGFVGDGIRDYLDPKRGGRL